MNNQTKPPHWIRDAPQLFTDREKLRLAIRAEIVKPDNKRDKPRLAALKERDDVLREAWRAQNPEKVAELESEQRDDEERYNDKDLNDLKESNPKAAQIRMDSNRQIEKLKNRELEALTQRDEVNAKAKMDRQIARNRELEMLTQRNEASAEIEAQRRRADRAEAGQTPRGVPFDKTSLAGKPDSHEFAAADFCEALKREKGHEAAIRRALTSWGRGTKRGSRWALTRGQAKAFWEWHNKARHKTHPPREKNKIARK